ncbi:MAG TPA: CrcB family protein [Acidimicrobiia bacterium]|jgi:CrcB protein
MNTVLAVVAGSVGALSRYVLTGAVQRRSQSALPLGTAAVNVLGALGIGLATGGLHSGSLPLVVVAGFLGGFTTFSTWMVETVRLGALPVWRPAALANLLVPLVSGVGAAAFGYYLTR